MYAVLTYSQPPAMKQFAARDWPAPLLSKLMSAPQIGKPLNHAASACFADAIFHC